MTVLHLKEASVPQKSAVALGFFDGVHLGHRAVLQAAAECAERQHLRACAFTFAADSVPVKQGTPLRYLYTDAHKFALLEACGMEAVFCPPFPSLCQLDGAAFCRTVLQDLFGAEEVFCGSDFRFGAKAAWGIDALRERIRGRVSAFAGNSGVGKSSVLNRLDSSFGAEVGAISDKIGRGKHTTRHVELHPIEGGGYIADTPGFSSFETEQMDLVLAEDLQYAFPEFEPYIGQCKFTGCAHVKEKGCAVLAAVENGEIAKTRHESYVKLYESVKDLKEWELTKGGTR